MPTDGASRISSKLHKVLTSGRIAKPRPAGVSADDVQALLAIALGEDRVEGISGHLAVRAVAGAEDKELAVQSLASLLRADAGTTIRVAAARELGALATEGAERVLRDNASEQEPEVQQQVFDSLGRFAGPAALDDLRDAAEPKHPAARRQFHFARALIAHRHALEGPFLPDVDRAGGVTERGGKAAVKLAPAKGEGASDPRNLEGGTYGTDVGPVRYDVTCGGNTWTLLLNGELAPKRIEVERLLQRPWIAGIMARWMLEGRASVAQHVVLTRPIEDSVRIDVVRTDGTVMYTGMAKGGDSGVAFTIEHAKGAIAAPVHLEGTAGVEGVDFTKSIASERRVGVRSVQAAIPS